MRIFRGFHQSVDNRNNRVVEGKNSLPFRGAIFSRVLKGSGDYERVWVDTVAGKREGPFSYPFSSANSWIRGQPEPTTTMISIIGGDTLDIQPIGYYDPAKSGTAREYSSTTTNIRQNPTADVATSITPYRVLNPGELDIASNFAQTFLGKVDVHQSRGGFSHWTLSSLQSKLETPLFSIKGSAHQLDTLGSLRDEFRYGTVRRTVLGTSTATNQSLIKDTGINTRSPLTPVFAKEFSVLLNGFGLPGKLLDHRQGNVVEDNGDFARSLQTSKKLRARLQWHSLNGFTTTEIDDAGNTLFETSGDANEGLIANIPSGNVNIKVGGQNLFGGGRFTVQSTGNMLLSTSSRAALTAEEGFQIQTRQRGGIRANAGLEVKSDSSIVINTPTALGVKVGSGFGISQYPALVAHPDYISTLNNYYSSQLSFSQSVVAYANSAAMAWSAIGPVFMLLDPSGTLMGLCLAAASSAGAMAAQAAPVSSAITNHIPRLTQMPFGFMSGKLTAE